MIAFHGDRENWRIDRLIRAYSRMSTNVRGAICCMRDESGHLVVVVCKILPELTEEIRKAWEVECEYSFEILQDGEKIYHTWGDKR